MSLASLLPQYVHALGKKIDLAEEAKVCILVGFPGCWVYTSIYIRNNIVSIVCFKFDSICSEGLGYHITFSSLPGKASEEFGGPCEDASRMQKGSHEMSLTSTLNK